MPLRDNMEKHGRIVQSTDDNIIRGKRFESWLIKAINKYLECVTFIAFPRQKWLREIASMLRFSVHHLLFFFSKISHIDSYLADIPVRKIHFIRREDCGLTENLLPKIVPADYPHD
jgi:hypothetical protein